MIRRRRRPATAGAVRGRGEPEPSLGSAPRGRALKVGLGFIPSVQFAPFYLADQAGYYDGRPAST